MCDKGILCILISDWMWIFKIETENFYIEKKCRKTLSVNCTMFDDKT